ncbi:hypothetical protein GHT06_017772 [Daphnia sinensis]|uniref:Uncharacterized protein n=1 Tax=Daphnia sinensis TaxID=1820382 RepID=A0AAD5PQC0_9CRUS|nr:hypothetical protein GHT06_017772 [Daphnia sinensis]
MWVSLSPLAIDVFRIRLRTHSRHFTPVEYNPRPTLTFILNDIISSRYCKKRSSFHSRVKKTNFSLLQALSLFFFSLDHSFSKLICGEMLIVWRWQKKICFVNLENEKNESKKEKEKKNQVFAFFGSNFFFHCFYD